MAKVESLICTNYCALCGKSINGDNQYYCLSVSLTSELCKQIHMDKPKYGYFCTDCGDKLGHMFNEDNEAISED